MYMKVIAAILVVTVYGEGLEKHRRQYRQQAEAMMIDVDMCKLETKVAKVSFRSNSEKKHVLSDV